MGNKEARPKSGRSKSVISAEAMDPARAALMEKKRAFITPFPEQQYDAVENHVNYFDVSIREQIGKGDYGPCYTAVYEREKVVAKVYTFSTKEDEQERIKVKKQLESEIAIFNNAVHKNVLLYLGVCTNESNVVILRCLHEHDSLHDVLIMKKMKKQEFEFSMHNKLDMLLGVGRGLSFLYGRKWMHGNLTMRNIMLVEEKIRNSAGEEEVLYTTKIADFGLLRYKKSFEKCQKDGTEDKVLAVVPPEVARGEPYTMAGEAFAFAFIMWQVLFEKCAFADSEDFAMVPRKIASDASYRPTVPPETSDESVEHGMYVKLMKQLWSHDPLDRPTWPDIMLELQTIRDYQRNEELKRL